MEKLEKPAGKIIKDLIYTVMHDVSNDFIANGADAKEVLEVVNKRAAMYAEGDIKIKKNPAPRAPRATKKQVTAQSASASGGGEVVNAAKSIMNKKWAPHPINEQYAYYLPDIPHNKGSHFLKDVNTNTVIGTINDEGDSALTPQDVRVATSLGFKVSK